MYVNRRKEMSVRIETGFSMLLMKKLFQTTWYVFCVSVILTHASKTVISIIISSILVHANRTVIRIIISSILVVQYTVVV